jgi:hypothetical protein
LTIARLKIAREHYGATIVEEGERTKRERQEGVANTNKKQIKIKKFSPNNNKMK